MTQAAQTAPTTALQKFKEKASFLESDAVKAAIARALPKHLTAERMIRVALTAIQKTPKLAECDDRSLIGAIVQASELGLEPNTPLGQAYLIPFFNAKTKRTEVQLVPGYRGLITLARRSGQVKNIYSEIVYERDVFEVTYGLHKDLVHKPALGQDRGELIGAYAVAIFADGGNDFEYMDAVQINKIRRRSKSADAGPWVTDTEEMWRKTPIRRLWKRLPQSIEDNTLTKAITLLDEHDGVVVSEALDLSLPEAVTTATITEDQRIELVALAKTLGIADSLASIVNLAGFEMLADITVDKFDGIVADLNAIADEAVEAEEIKDDGKNNELGSGTENLRAQVSELLNALPNSRRKDMLAGRTSVSKMNKDELETLRDTIEAETN